VFNRPARTDRAAPVPLVWLEAIHRRHFGAALGEMAANRRMRFRIARYRRREIATSAN
jgi:hypothetical protein